MLQYIFIELTGDPFTRSALGMSLVAFVQEPFVFKYNMKVPLIQRILCGVVAIVTAL